MTDVVCVGEAMVSLRSQGRLRLGDPMVASVAGAESNVAIGLARLGHAVAWVGQVGSDELGELVLRTLRAEGVHVRARRDPTRSTGLMFREQRTGDIVHVDYVRRGSAGSALDVALVEAALEPDPTLLHVSGVTPALSETNAKATVAALRRARELGAVTSLDLNYRSRLWSRAEATATLRILLPDVDVLFASADELPLVLDTAPPGDRVAEVVVTHGADGAQAWEAGRHARVAARPVRVVDPVGAGDAFVAGYLSARLEGLDLASRLARGTDVAAVAVGSAGDWEGLPTRPELAAFAGDHDGMLR
jgi:2-dehydro-3-deoxygluconokinase